MFKNRFRDQIITVLHLCQHTEKLPSPELQYVDGQCGVSCFFLTINMLYSSWLAVTFYFGLFLLESSRSLYTVSHWGFYSLSAMLGAQDKPKQA